jgi:hypothetical protein
MAAGELNAAIALQGSPVRQDRDHPDRARAIDEAVV